MCIQFILWRPIEWSPVGSITMCTQPASFFFTSLVCVFKFCIIYFESVYLVAIYLIITNTLQFQLWISIYIKIIFDGIVV